MASVPIPEFGERGASRRVLHKHVTYQEKFIVRFGCVKEVTFNGSQVVK